MFEHREKGNDMKDPTIAATPDFFDGDSRHTSAIAHIHRTDTWFQTGTFIFTKNSCVFKTGQPAASCKSHLGNIPEIELTHTTGDPMETN
jgi:hypothetical protein